MTDLAEIDLETARMTRGNFDVLAGDPSKRAYLPLSYRTYLRAASGYSLRTSTCSEEFAKRLEEFDPLPVLRSLLDIADSGEWPSLFSRFNALDVDLIAIPVLLNSPSLAVRYLESCLLRSTSVPLWNTYVDGLASLVRGTSFEPTYPKQPKGLEKHWVLYIRLMATIRHGQSIDGISSEIAASFERCNSDRRLHVHSSFDPNGTHPVPWDLRLAYVRALGALGA